jgi:hypothetical protein
MDYSPELLNKALALSLEWGEHWLDLIEKRLKKKKASMTERQLTVIDHLCRLKVQSW